MGKVKIKKSDVWIDMTPMSDVMVLLLTFFMLTSTFVKNEAVKVNTPGSVSEIKIPEKPDISTLSVLIDKTGKVFIGLDKPKYMQDALMDVAGKLQVNVKNPTALENFASLATFGAKVDDNLVKLLMNDSGKINEMQKEMGIPTDSIAGGMSQFQIWVDAARNLKTKDKTGTEKKLKMQICIKADAATPYAKIKKVMSELQDMSENRYYLITTLKTNAED